MILAFCAATFSKGPYLPYIHYDAVPSARVIARRTSDNAQCVTLADADGRYEFPPVPPGKYKLTVEGMPLLFPPAAVGFCLGTNRPFPNHRSLLEEVACDKFGRLPILLHRLRKCSHSRTCKMADAPVLIHGIPVPISGELLLLVNDHGHILRRRAQRW